MSEQSSFVTEHIRCVNCLEKLKAILLKEEEYLTSIQIPLWTPYDAVFGDWVEYLPIIAGNIVTSWPLAELTILQKLFNSNNAPCHRVRISILHDCGNSSTVIVAPDGSVFLSSTTSK